MNDTDEETEFFTPSANEARITAFAEQNGWNVHKRDGLRSTIEYRKHGRGYLWIYFADNGRVIKAATNRKYLTPNTASVKKHLEGR